MAVSWEVWLEDSENRSLIVQTTNRSGFGNTGAVLDPESTTSTSLMIRNGPYLMIGASVSLYIKFRHNNTYGIIHTQPGIVHEVH